MARTIEISDHSATLLAQQAAERGLSLEAWIETWAREKASINPQHQIIASPNKARAAVEGILQLQKLVQPDPDGLTIHDYLKLGRR